MKDSELSGLIIVGGYEAIAAATELIEFGIKIPIIIVPATISNNFPGTEFTIGADTSLNVVVESCDRIKTSATGKC
jgi:6-phosphofructokinase 1